MSQTAKGKAMLQWWMNEFHIFLAAFARGARAHGHMLLTMLVSGLMILALAACTQGNIGEPVGVTTTNPPTQTDSTPKPTITDVKYQLPDGWVPEEGGGLNALLLSKTRPESPEPLNKIEFMGIEDWTEKQGQQWVWEDYQYNKSGCDYSISHGTPEDCQPAPEYKELTIAGTKVYVSMDVNYTWGTPEWASRLSFFKNGMVVKLDLLSRADKSIDILKRIITTLTWKKVQQ